MEIVKKWKGFEQIANKLSQYCKNIRENLLKTMHPIKNEIKVLNHGDPWVNNFLFKYNEQQMPSDVIFVDFQLSHWGSPGIDLNYFFYTSCSLEDLVLNREKLLKAYYESFEATLRSNDWINIPSFEDLEKCVLQRESYGFFASFAILPIISLNKQASQDNSLDNMANEEYAKGKIVEMYTTPRVVETLKYCLKKFYAMKIFD